MTTPTSKSVTYPALKPCPLCGNAIIYMEPDEVGSGGQWVSPIHVGCVDCRLDVESEDREEAVAKWNDRVAHETPARNLVTLTAQQLRDAADFGDPDHDAEQATTEISIEYSESGINGPGYYAWYTEYPEEGCIPLFDVSSVTTSGDAP